MAAWWHHSCSCHENIPSSLMVHTKYFLALAACSCRKPMSNRSLSREQTLHFNGMLRTRSNHGWTAFLVSSTSKLWLTKPNTLLHQTWLSALTALGSHLVVPVQWRQPLRSHCAPFVNSKSHVFKELSLKKIPNLPGRLLRLNSYEIPTVSTCAKPIRDISWHPGWLVGIHITASCNPPKFNWVVYFHPQSRTTKSGAQFFSLLTCFSIPPKKNHEVKGPVPSINVSSMSWWMASLHLSLIFPSGK